MINIWCPKAQRLILKPRVSIKRSFQGVNCGLLNARSVNEKESSIYELITDNRLDICAITETWLKNVKSSDSLGQLTPPGYTITHLPRPANRTGEIGRASCGERV